MLKYPDKRQEFSWKCVFRVFGSIVMGTSWIWIFMKMNIFLFEHWTARIFWIQIFLTHVCGSSRGEQDRFWPIKQKSRLSFLNINFNQDSRICLVKYQCQSRFKISKIKILISIKIQEILWGNNVIKQDPRTCGNSQDQARFKTTFWY